jgi:hypothetical protein
MLSQYDIVEYIIAQTKADLHCPGNNLSALAEEFGEGYQHQPSLRNADNRLKLEDVQASSDVYKVSSVFTGAVYFILADIFSSMRNPRFRDDADVLHEAGKYVACLVTRAMINSPAQDAIFEDVADEMVKLAKQDGFDDRSQIISKNFISRGILGVRGLVRPSKVKADRSKLRGTLALPEYQVPDK